MAVPDTLAEISSEALERYYGLRHENHLYG
jgi:hypothetical protein